MVSFEFLQAKRDTFPHGFGNSTLCHYIQGSHAGNRRYKVKSNQQEGSVYGILEKCPSLKKDNRFSIKTITEKSFMDYSV